MVKLSDTEMFKAFRELVTTDPNNPKKTSSDPIRRAKALGCWQRLMDTHNIAGMIKTAEKQAAELRSPDSMISDADIAWEQRAREAADTDLREACRQYYWPQWSAHDVLHDGSTRKNAIRTHLDILYALGQVDRDMILKANGCWSQREFEGNRQSMVANGTNFAKGSLEKDSAWKMNTIGNRPPYQYLDG